MFKISDAVTEILLADEVALEALRSNILNLSAYAKKILPQVEEKTWKEVQPSSIVVALSRMSGKISDIPELHPQVVLDDISIKSPLVDISYDKTEQNLRSLRQFQQSIASNANHFIMVTQGTREITIIVPEELMQVVLDSFNQEPKEIYKNLVGISASFSESYLEMPNVIYAVLSAFAGVRINIREVVSTYTEISVIINKEKMEIAVKALQPFLGQKKTT